MIHNHQLKIFSGRANLPAGREDRPVPGRPARQDHARQLPRRRNLGPHRRGRARPRRLRRPADLPAGQREPDGAADHARQLQAGQRRPHHGRPALLRLRPPGPQGRGPRADHRQAGRRPARPSAGADRVLAPRPARRPDPGLLRHPGRSPARRPGHQRLRPQPGHPAARLRRPQPGRGQHQAGARSTRRSWAARIAIVDKRRASATETKHGQPDRRVAGGQGGGHLRRHDLDRRQRRRGGQRRQDATAPARSTPAPRTASCAARPSSGCATRPSSRSSSPTASRCRRRSSCRTSRCSAWRRCWPTPSSASTSTSR